MNEQIKQRIAQLNNGEVPNGYENTDFGIFPCDWVKDKTFGDLFDFYGGLGKSRDELGDEGHAYLHYGDLHRGAFNVVSHEQYEQLPKYDVVLKGTETYLMEDGDVAFLDASEDLEGTSRAVLIDNPDNDPFIAGLHIIYGKSKDESLEKWYKQYITTSESVRKQFQRLASGFKVYGVTREILPKIQIAYPKSTEEQSKIAEILMKWDEAIELYNQLIEKLKQLKSVCLKKMFPQRGEKVPEWRFKGFTDAWEQRKLGELFSFRYGDGNTNPSNGGQYPVFGAGGIQGGYTEFNAENSIIIGHMGDAGCVSWGDGKHFVTYNGTITKPKNDIFSSKFGYYLLLSMDLRKYRGGSGLPFLTYEMLTEMWTQIPKEKDETRLIAECFSYLDNLITLHQCKVEKIKAQQRVLQKYLLNGIVRV